LYADFPERWKAVMKDVLSCDRDLALAANICYSQDNRNKTLEKFNEVFREIALEGEHAENVAHLILHPEHPFCLRNIPEKDGYEFNAPEHISKMFLPERFIYFINGVGGRQFIGVRRSMITKIGRAKSLKEKTFGQCECSDFFQNFDAILHLDPDGNWYSNFNCPKLPAMRLGHITKDSIEDILRRKYYFWSIMTRMLLLDQRPYEAHMPCDVCVKICSEYDLMASAAEEM
jgi:hypothetical protein